MGVVNVTPDSFSDGGRYLATRDAIAHGMSLAAHGADIVDVGGESTRPGSEAIAAGAEIDRVLPVVSALAAAGVVVSVDTSKAEVALVAIGAGAEIVNDVTSFGDPDMASACVASEVGVVLMHMQGTPQTMQVDPTYGDVVAEVAGYLERRAATAIEAGVASDRICIDPGIGFGKTFEHNLELLANLSSLTDGPHPVLVGPSRKHFLSRIMELHGREGLSERPDAATGAVVATSIWQGAAVIRVHDVESAADVGRVADAIVRSDR